MMRNTESPAEYAARQAPALVALDKLADMMGNTGELPEHPGPVDQHVNTCPHCERGQGRRTSGRQLRCVTSEVTRTTYHRGTKSGTKTTTQPGCGYEWNG